MASIDLERFWLTCEQTPRSLANKKGISRFSYLLLYHYFKHEYKFFKNLSDIPMEVITRGMKELGYNGSGKALQLFFKQKERLVYRYKDEIRKHFGFSAFSKAAAKLLRPLTHMFNLPTKDSRLVAAVSSELISNKIEIPEDDILLSLTKGVKTTQEQTLLFKVAAQLTAEEKKWLEVTVLQNIDKDGVKAFLKQDSGASTKQGIKEELERLQILKVLPFNKWRFLEEIPEKRLSLFRRKFLSQTPQQMQRRSESTKYGLVVLFLYHRYREAIDNLADHLLDLIHRMRKQATRKKAALKRELAKQVGVLGNLYKIAEISRDQPKGIIEEAIYSKVSLNNIEEILELKELSKGLKKVVREAVVKRYSNVYRNPIFTILKELDLQSTNKAFVDAIEYIKRPCIP